MGELLPTYPENEPPDFLQHPHNERQPIGDPFMSYITDCAIQLMKQSELRAHIVDIHTANEKLQRIVERFHIPTDATYLPGQYQFQIATLSLALARLVPDTEENNFENPYVQAIEKLLRSAAEREVITEDIDHLVVAITVIDGLPKTLQEQFQPKRQEFVELYKSTRGKPDEHHLALTVADDWLKAIKHEYAKDDVLRLTFPDREAYNRAYKKICKDLEFTETEENANYASGMGLTNISLAILCIEELMDPELEAHEREHLGRNLSLFGLFGDALEEALVETESLLKVKHLNSPRDLHLTEENFSVKVFYLREMQLLQNLHKRDPKVYELLDAMSKINSSPDDAEKFAVRCIERFGLEGLASLYLAGIVPLDENKEKEDPSLFMGREYGKLPTVDVQERLEKLFAHYSSNLLVM